MRKKVVYDAEFNTQEAEKNAETLNNKFKGASESAESIKGNTDGAAKSTEKLGDESKKAAKETEGIDKAAKKSKGGVSLLSKSFKGLGGAMKAAGIGIIVGLAAKLTEMLSENQEVADAINKAFTALGIVFQQFTEPIITLIQSISAAGENFDALGRVGKSVLNLVFTPIKLVFKEIQLGILAAQLAWEKSFFGDDDPETIERLENGLSQVKDDIIEIGKDAVESGKTIVNNVGEAFVEAKDIFVKSKDAIVKGYENIDVAGAKASANEIDRKRKQAEFDEIEQQKLFDNYDRQAELQRQNRDDTNATIEERIAANERLSEILNEQAKAEKKTVKDRINAIEQENSLLGGTQKRNVELAQLKAELVAIDADIEGKRTEQLTNRNSLLEEQKQNLRELALIGKSEQERAILEAEQEAERQREQLERTVTNEARKAELLANIQSEFENTVANINAEAEAKKQEAEAKTEAERIKNHKADLARAEAEKNAKIQVAQSVLSATSSFLEQGSNAAKAVAVAQTTIDTYKSAQAAYSAMAGIPVIGPGLGIAAAAAAVAAGVANVRKIMQTNPEGGGSAPSMSGMSASGAGGAIGGGVPNITSGQRQEATNVDAQEALRRQQNADNPPIQAYVLEGNITNAQEAQRKLENSARL